MITHLQCVIIKNQDTSFKVALPREIRVKYTKYGPRPLPKSVRDQRYFSVSAPLKDFETPNDFLEAVSKCLDKYIQDGKEMDLEVLRHRFKEECGFRVGQVERTVKSTGKSNKRIKDLDDMFERGKF